ncbi:MAG: hypothetical protein ACYDCK_15050 [Thermoplasmatota archaeon]
MNRTTARVLIVSLVALTALPFVTASVRADLDPTCFNEKVIAIGPPASAPVAYLVVDAATGAQWLYLESNGVAGLQRGGAGPTQPVWDATGNAVLTDIDTCQMGGTPDTLVF